METQVVDDTEKKRVENLKHRKEINNGILKRFVELGIQPELAKNVITAIVNNQVVNLTIKY